MNLIIILLTFLGCFSMAGCSSDSKPESSSEEPTPIIVTFGWIGYNGYDQAEPENVAYDIDGLDVGNGTEGFNNVIVKIKEMPPYSMILVYPDLYESDMGRYNDNVSPAEDLARHIIDAMPFRKIQPQYHQFLNIVQERKLGIWYHRQGREYYRIPLPAE